MKRLLAVLILFLFLVGCAAPAEQADIAATTLPVYEFTSRLCEGTGLKVAKWMRPYMTFVLPVIILVLLIVGLLPSKG